MTKPVTTKPNPKAAWAKELHVGQEGSAWRLGGGIVDDQMKIAHGMLDKAGLSYTASDLIRLTRVLIYGSDLDHIVALAKARLDCEGISYGATDLVEMITLLSDCMNRTQEIMDKNEAEHAEDCADRANQPPH